jgi:ATP-dependent DNA helicase RecG
VGRPPFPGEAGTSPVGQRLPLDRRLGQSGLPGARVLGRVGGRLGLLTVRDLLFHLPREVRDLRHLRSAASMRDLDDGTLASARLRVASLRVDATIRRRVQRTVAILRDDTGEVEATWFGRRYIERRLREGDVVIVSGKVKHRGRRVTIDNPDFQPDEPARLLHVGRIVPVYRLTEGLSQRVVRSAVRAALDRVGPYPEYLPATVLGDRMAIAGSLAAVHFPDEPELRGRALDRLAFDELVALQVGMISRQRVRRGTTGWRVEVTDERYREAVAAVESVLGEAIRRRMGADRAPADIRLTPDQRAALDHIRADLAGDRPMLRLLQGDVGSGKTAVAALAVAFVADAGGQSALLAPTDLLARQHAATLAALLEPLGHGVTLLTASVPAAERRAALELAASPPGAGFDGRTAGRVVVGTHALVQEGVAFAELRLAVVDEQHRFGVAERDALAGKGSTPHVLLMTATPIPRTLGQVLHADLDVSDLRAAPTGRGAIRTAARSDLELLRRRDGRPGPLPYLAQEVAAGHRGFVVAPLVHPPEPDDETGLPAETGTDVGAARDLIHQSWDEACALGGVAGTTLRAGVIHGQMKPVERDAAMDAFRAGEVDVLVGTTVLEVGVDVPEATVMLVLDADRFGVAQLHQLRGRVGRGAADSACVLMSSLYPDPDLPEARLSPDERLVRARLDALAATRDGFALAELDLQLRKEGEQLGLQQSGLPPLRIASLADAGHRRLTREARAVAERLVTEDGRLRPDLTGLAIELERGWLARIGAGEALRPDEADA